MKNMENKEDVMSEIVINKEPSFIEKWHEGHIEYNGEKYQFWLLHPEGVDPHGNDYECELRWFFKHVPREVRMMYNYILESFKQTIDDPRVKKSN
jgi:hypothetical protein